MHYNNSQWWSCTWCYALDLDSVTTGMEGDAIDIISLLICFFV